MKIIIPNDFIEKFKPKGNIIFQDCVHKDLTNHQFWIVKLDDTKPDQTNSLSKNLQE